MALSIQQKILRSKMRRIASDAMKKAGMSKDQIAQVYSDTPVGEFLRARTAQSMIASGVEPEKVAVIMENLV